MTRACTGALVALALAAGLALRLTRLDARPMHHDEANQAVKLGDLLERGEYTYDAHDHHGPTLYYLSLPAAKLRGQTTLASLDEHTLRGVTALFGAATILLLPLLSSGIGRIAVAVSAILMALSPAMVFYSRMYIQESLFTFFTLAFVIAVGRAATGAGLAWAALAGVAAGLTLATKETSAIVLPSALAACAIAWWSLGPDRLALSAVEGPRTPSSRRPWIAAVLIGAGVALAVAALFYSSFLTSPRSVLDPFRAAGPYLDRAIEPVRHVHPWHFYLGLLTYFASGGLKWSEGLVLALAIVGGVTGLQRHTPPERTFWLRYLTCYAIVATVIYSAIPYKTPWNVLPFYVGIIIVAGIGFSTLLHLTRSRALRAAIVLVFVADSGHLAWQAWRASVTYASDQRNPYVYAQTVPDAVRMATRIRELARLHPDGSAMLVSVIAPPHEQWPLPWYLRTMPHVGYWTAPGDALAMQAPVVVASMDHAPAVEAALGDRYVSEFYGVRPEVLVTLFVERGLWDRFLQRVTGENPTSACPGGEHTDRCGPAPAVALWRATSTP